jgi:hypothetical protein
MLAQIIFHLHLIRSQKCSCLQFHAFMIAGRYNLLPLPRI